MFNDSLAERKIRQGSRRHKTSMFGLQENKGVVPRENFDLYFRSSALREEPTPGTAKLFMNTNTASFVIRHRPS